MAKSGTNFKQLLLEKGEKFGLYGAAVLMVGLMGLGAMALLDRQNPAEYAAQVKSKSEQIRNQVNSPGAKIDPLTGAITEAVSTSMAKGEALARTFFEPTQLPDNKRLNPVVLGVTEGQSDFVLCKILANDIREVTEGEFEVGVIEVLGKKDEKNAGTGEFLKDLNIRTKVKTAPKRVYPNNPMNPMGFPMNPMGFPMNPMNPMGGFPMNPMPLNPVVSQPAGPAGAGMAPYNPNAAGNFGSDMSPGGQLGAGQRYGVSYVKLDEKALANKRIALTIRPQPMVIVQASFPYRQQLEQIRKALRLTSVNDIFLTPDAAPYFRGQATTDANYPAPSVTLQRRVTNPAGKEIESWSDIRYDENFRPVFQRKIADRDEDPLMEYVILRDQDLSMPLPAIISGKYPEVALNSLKDAAKKLKDLNKPLAPPPTGPNKLLGQGNIFTRQTGPKNTTMYGPAGALGMEGDMGLSIPGVTMPKRMSPMEMPPSGTPGTGTGTNAISYEPPDAVLVRVIDVDVKPGLVYQYRIQVQMQNPNWKKKELCSLPSDADVEVLSSPFVEIGKPVRMPEDRYLFAVDPPAPTADKKNAVTLKEGQAMLQFQRWMRSAKVGDKIDEPVGDWVVADMIVSRGQYVGGKQFVNLPLWASEFNEYVLRELTGEKVAKGKDPRKGVTMEPIRWGDMLAVEIEGGKTTMKTVKGNITEDSAAEILLLKADGSMEVRSSLTDRMNEGRKEREEGWKKWIEETEKRTNKLLPGSTPMGKDPNFN